MWQALLWKIIWTVLPILLGIAKDFILETISAVTDAEKIETASADKRAYVWNRMVNYILVHNVEVTTRVMNAVLELTVVYVKNQLPK